MPGPHYSDDDCYNILVYINNGYSLRRIAKRLCRSVASIETKLGSIESKLTLHNYLILGISFRYNDEDYTPGWSKIKVTRKRNTEQPYKFTVMEDNLDRKPKKHIYNVESDDDTSERHDSDDHDDDDDDDDGDYFPDNKSDEENLDDDNDDESDEETEDDEETEEPEDDYNHRHSKRRRLDC